MIRRRDKDGETLRSIARSYNVNAATISSAMILGCSVLGYHL